MNYESKKIIIMSVAMFVVVVFFLHRGFPIKQQPLKQTEQVQLQDSDITGPCLIKANKDIAVYQRPHYESEVFGELSKGETQQISGQTESGWIAFEPSVAQAANIGIFRNRYISPNSEFTMVGSCNFEKKLVDLDATSCYLMADHEYKVYSKPDVNSKVISKVLLGGYPVVTSFVGKDSKDLSKYFAEIQNSDKTSGWIVGQELNLNGKCDF